MDTRHLIIVFLDQPLAKSHSLPRHSKAGLDLKVHIANLTRNRAGGALVIAADGRVRLLAGNGGQ